MDYYSPSLPPGYRGSQVPDTWRREAPQLPRKTCLKSAGDDPDRQKKKESADNLDWIPEDTELLSRIAPSKKNKSISDAPNQVSGENPKGDRNETLHRTDYGIFGLTSPTENDMTNESYIDDRLTPLTYEEEQFVCAVTALDRKNETLTPPQPTDVRLGSWYTIRGENLRRLCHPDRDGVLQTRVSGVTGDQSIFYLSDEEVNGLGSLFNLRSQRLRELQDQFDMSSALDSYVLSCFFVHKIFNFEIHSAYKRENSSTYDYEAVRRWTKRCPIWKCRYLIFPVNLTHFEHWVLFYFDFVRQEVRYECSLGWPDNGNIIEGMLRWLVDEIEDKRESGCDGAEILYTWHPHEWPVLINKNLNSAKQLDSTSCGLFTIFTAERLLMGLEPDFSQKDIPNLRKRAVLYLSRGFVPGLPRL